MVQCQGLVELRHSFGAALGNFVEGVFIVQVAGQLSILSDALAFWLHRKIGEHVDLETCNLDEDRAEDMLIYNRGRC